MQPSTVVIKLSERENILRDDASRILRLAPAPDIVEAIPAGRAAQSLMLYNLERPLPASWQEEREQLCW
jgi:hypothetical protein